MQDLDLERQRFHLPASETFNLETRNSDFTMMLEYDVTWTWWHRNIYKMNKKHELLSIKIASMIQNVPDLTPSQ